MQKRRIISLLLIGASVHLPSLLLGRDQKALAQNNKPSSPIQAPYGNTPASSFWQHRIRMYLKHLGMSADAISRIHIFQVGCDSIPGDPAGHSIPIGSRVEKSYIIYINESFLNECRQCQLEHVALFVCAHEAAHCAHHLFPLGNHSNGQKQEVEKAADLAAARMLCRVERKTLERYISYLDQENDAESYDTTTHHKPSTRSAYLKQVLVSGA